MTEGATGENEGDRSEKEREGERRKWELIFKG